MHGRSGADFLTALAVTYQVHTRLSDVAPVRDAATWRFAMSTNVAKLRGVNGPQNLCSTVMCSYSSLATIGSVMSKSLEYSRFGS
jgi:2-methylcitrate dehydratase